MNKVKVIAAAAMLVAAGVANADLARVGPVNVSTATTKGHGFPNWYQDHKGMVLDLCMPDLNDPGFAQASACILPIFPPEGGFVFPELFPEESFYFAAGSVLTTPGGNALLVMALEAAFASGTPTPGEQIVFARIRVRADITNPGTYTIRHPYGSKTYPDLPAGGRALNDTVDIGIGAPGVFTGALGGSVGPFLEHVADVRTGVQPRYTVNGATMLGDANDLGPVTGSQIKDGNGEFMNYFEMCGPWFVGQPDSCVRSVDFSLVGRLHNGSVPSPLAVERATYNRTAAGTRLDVSASASDRIGAGGVLIPPKLTLASSQFSPVLMDGPDHPTLKRYYAQSVPAAGSRILVSVTNSADDPPTTHTVETVDAITVSSARYDAMTKTLVVEASSSDKVDRPRFWIAELSDMTSTPDANDTSKVVLSKSGVSIPPAWVTVKSANGGRAVAEVETVGDTAAFAAGAPFAVNDAPLPFMAGSAVQIIDVLGNDKTDPSVPLLAAKLALVPAPTTPCTVPTIRGQVCVNAGKLQYLPQLNSGLATIHYTIENAVGKSNIGTVNVVLNANTSGRPTAVPDSATVRANTVTPIAIDVLANDEKNGTTTAMKVGTFTQPRAGTVTLDAATGRLLYKAPAAVPAADATHALGVVTFNYTTQGSGGTSDPTKVTVTVTAPETVAVNAGGATCRRASNAWVVRGTGNVVGSTLSLYRTASPSGSAFGSAIVQADGSWRYQGSGTACVSPISLRSNLGLTLSNIPVTIN
jgi:hypothetical protein